MNPLVRIGRFEAVPITSVQIIQRVETRRAKFVQRFPSLLRFKFAQSWTAPEYDVCFAGGFRLRMDAEEKAQLDHEIELHAAVRQVYGMFQTWQQSHGMR